MGFDVVTKTIKERLSHVETIIESHAGEIKGLRDSRHEHAGQLQNHAGILSAHSTIISGISTSVDKLADVVGKLSNSVNKIIWLFTGGMMVGSALLAAILYFAKEILKVW